MEEFKRAAERISKLKPDWREWYLNGEYLQISVWDELRQMLEDLIQLIQQKEKQFIDQPNEQEKKEWSRQAKELIGDSVFKKMESDSSSILSIYSDTKVIRNMGDSLPSFLSDVMVHYSVFYTGFYWKQDKLYGIDAQAVSQAVQAVHRIVYTHAGAHFSRQMAQKEFERVTGIKEPYSDYYAELYEKHYDRLQRNYMLYQMEQMEEKLDHLLIERTDNGSL